MPYYKLFLMGYITIVSSITAAPLEFQTQTWQTDPLMAAKIAWELDYLPYQWHLDGDEARAFYIGTELLMHGFLVRRIEIEALPGHSLRVKPRQDNVLPSLPPIDPVWSYHSALSLTDKGEEWIIDPILSPVPLRILDWLKLMSVNEHDALLYEGPFTALHLKLKHLGEDILDGNNQAHLVEPWPKIQELHLVNLCGELLARLSPIMEIKWTAEDDQEAKRRVDRLLERTSQLKDQLLGLGLLLEEDDPFWRYSPQHCRDAAAL
ncbi:MAG: hypothetical protein NTX25_21880 [Proteobacteria bacterium]|nr:hypothetical protein [Pseudomonadota bacterium]